MSNGLDLDMDLELEMGQIEPSPDLDLGLELEFEPEQEIDLQDSLDELLAESEISLGVLTEEEEEADKQQEELNKFIKAREQANERKSEELVRVVGMYRGESLDGTLQFKVLENIRDAVQSKFPKSADNWEREALSRAPAQFWTPSSQR